MDEAVTYRPWQPWFPVSDEYGEPVHITEVMSAEDYRAERSERSGTEVRRDITDMPAWPDSKEEGS